MTTKKQDQDSLDNQALQEALAGANGGPLNVSTDHAKALIRLGCQVAYDAHGNLIVQGADGEQGPLELGDEDVASLFVSAVRLGVQQRDRHFESHCLAYVGKSTVAWIESQLSGSVLRDMGPMAIRSVQKHMVDFALRCEEQLEELVGDDYAKHRMKGYLGGDHDVVIHPLEHEAERFDLQIPCFVAVMRALDGEKLTIEDLEPATRDGGDGDDDDDPDGDDDDPDPCTPARGEDLFSRDQLQGSQPY